MRRGANINHGRAGFTLLETIVVLSLIALLAGMASPLLRSPSERLRLESAMNTFCATLRSTRARAIASNVEKIVVIDLVNKTYVSSASVNGKLPADASIQLQVANTQHLGDNFGSIIFFPDGSSTGGNLIFKILGAQAIIGINWLTGGAKCVVS